jgi:predicted XRE-type DNA-binding protein
MGTVNGIDTLIGTGFRDSESGHEFGIGIFVRGSLQRQINEQWRLRCFIQAEIAESFEVSNGASSVDIDPSGYSVGLGATFSY